MVYIESIPASLQRKRTITVGQQDEDHDEARDSDHGRCCARRWGLATGWWWPCFRSPLSAAGWWSGPPRAGHRWRGGRACGRRDEPSRAEGRFGEQLDAGQAGMVVVAVSDLGATRC